ncbi:MAG TPA: hypothetical protein VK914_04015 [bacterium]|jgi:hypothetical protein|nr:hypothetical protein [bacterium]
MADQFSVRRQLDAESEDLYQELKERREAVLEEERERVKRLVRLKVGYYFDPVTREILRRVGSQYVFVRHDRRRLGRLKPAEAETGRMRLIQGGLFWDPTINAVYQFRSGHYVLYSRDRRKTLAGKNPAGNERRKARS